MGDMAGAGTGSMFILDTGGRMPFAKGRGACAGGAGGGAWMGDVGLYGSTSGVHAGELARSTGLGGGAVEAAAAASSVLVAIRRGPRIAVVGGCGTGATTAGLVKSGRETATGMSFRVGGVTTSVEGISSTISSRGGASSDASTSAKFNPSSDSRISSPSSSSPSDEFESLTTESLSSSSPSPIMRASSSATSSEV